MTIKEYALINLESSIVESTILWDGDTSTWNPSSGYQAIDEMAFPYLVWSWDEQQSDWILIEEQNRMDGDVVGATFNGTEFITSQPKPDPIVQPSADGDIQTL